MDCQECGERGGQTRCEECQKIFCITCIRKHYDGLVDKFNSIADSRNELKEVLNAIQSAGADGSGWLIISEIEQWERNTIKHIQAIGHELRNDANTMMRITVEGMEKRLNDISRLIQDTQEKQKYSEHDSMSLEHQIKELREEINDIERNIRFHSQNFNELDWKSLIFITDNSIVNPADQVLSISTAQNRPIQIQRWSTDQQLYSATKIVRPEHKDFSEPCGNIQERAWNSQTILSPTVYKPTTSRKTCRICKEDFEYLSSMGTCRGCDSRQGILKNNGVPSPKLNHQPAIKSKSAADFTGSFTRDGTESLFPDRLDSTLLPFRIRDKRPIICSNCRTANSASLANSLGRRCKTCDKFLTVRLKGNEDEV